jgi:MFS family permease
MNGVPPTRTEPVPGARLALTLLLLINLFNYIDRYVLAQLISPIRHALLPNDPNALQKMGWLVSAFLISYMVISPVFGWLADRFPRWKLIALGVILWSLASGASGLALTFAMLLATRVFIGVGEAAYGPVAPTLIADLYPVSRRGNVLAWFYAAIPVGSAFGYLLGSAMLSHWRWAFYAVMPPGVLLGIWCILMPEPQRGLSDSLHGPAHKASLADYLVLLHTPSYVLDCIGMTLMTFAIGGIAVFMPTYLTEVRHLPGGQSGFIFSIILAVGGLTATLVGGVVGDKLRTKIPGAYFLVSAAGLLTGFPLLLLMLKTPFPVAWVFLFLAVFCLFFNTGPSNTILANVTHPSVRATAFAINILIIHAFGDALSPPLIGWVADHHGLGAGFVIVSLAMVGGGLVWLWGCRYLDRDTATAPTRLAPPLPGGFPVVVNETRS